MKIISSSLLILVLTSCAAKEMSYTGSTPAAQVIRSFLGISMTDSIDFIRWKLTISDSKYKLHCNYGIGKPNTNGFYYNGKTVELNGELKKEKNTYHLLNKNQTLNIAELNNDLLHFLDGDNKPLKGNGGWSYTINSMTPLVTDEISMISKQISLNDSMVFEGRTPCGVPGIIEPGKECYKLKWYFVLYADPVKNQPTTYRVLGTGWRVEGGKKGNWKIITGKNGQIIYQLYDEKGNTLIRLLKPDENILLFADANGKLLVGDHDFSYTLSRKF